MSFLTYKKHKQTHINHSNIFIVKNAQMSRSFWSSTGVPFVSGTFFHFIMCTKTVTYRTDFFFVKVLSKLFLCSSLK